MDDRHWLALVMWDEAQGESAEGQAAVGNVVLKRTKLRYCSDGTLMGTITAHFQFSGFYFTMEHGTYTQIEKDVPGAIIRAGQLMTQAQNTAAFAQCLAIADQLLANSYVNDDPQFLALINCPTAVLYLNPAVCKSPAWAIPNRHVATIGHHWFYSSVDLDFGHNASEAAVG